MNKRLTIRNIAQLAGVSPAAVSFAINNREGLSPETRKRILEIVEKTGYEPERIGVRESQTRTNNIAIITRKDLNYMDQLFYTELNNSVMQASDGLPYNLMYAPAYSLNGYVMLPEVITSWQVDGVLAYGDVEQAILDAVAALKIPLVVLDSSRQNSDGLTVSVDYETASYVAVRHLIELGHRDIAYIGNEEMHDFSIRTFNGFQRAIMESALDLSINRIQMNVFDESSLYAGIDHAMLGKKGPTAMFFTTDFYAIHAMRYLHGKNIRVPEDISIIGIDDIILSKFCIPSLSTVNVDRESMGELGFELLMKRISNEACESITLPSCDLVIRESTCPPDASRT